MPYLTFNRQLLKIIKIKNDNFIIIKHKYYRIRK